MIVDDGAIERSMFEGRTCISWETTIYPDRQTGNASFGVAVSLIHILCVRFYHAILLYRRRVLCALCYLSFYPLSFALLFHVVKRWKSSTERRCTP